jgi:hypothetical protein
MQRKLGWNRERKILWKKRTAREGFFEKKAAWERRSFAFKPRVSIDRWGDTGKVLGPC